MSRPSRPHSGAEHASALPAWTHLIALVWFVAFAAFFLSRPLEHQPDLRRFDLLLLLPELLSSKFVVGPDDLPAGWRYLPQRFDLMATAAFVAAGIISIGRLALRSLFAVTWRRHVEDAPKLAVDRLEWNLLAIGLGIAIWSLTTLACGLAGAVSRPLFVSMLLLAILVELLTAIVNRRSASTVTRDERSPRQRRIAVPAVLAVLPFLLATALGSMLPPYAFDVKEYHLGGPKEWFLEGGIHFLPHNVYTSFPQLTEMLSLSSMVVRDDWYRGALAGQLLLAGFFPLTGAAIFATGRRLFGTAAGMLAAVVYLTTPWTYQLSVMAYVEGGLSAFLALSVCAFTLAVTNRASGCADQTMSLLTGVFAGSAMACKYTGIVQSVIPLGMALVAVPLLSRRSIEHDSTSTARFGRAMWADILVPVGLYALGVVLFVGPWLVRNLADTGNPVYPLLWTVFGGSDWNATLNAKWQAAHRPPGFALASLVTDLRRVVVDSGGQSLLVFGLAPLALMGPHRRQAGWLWFYLVYLMAAWWVLTHRIDRFWVPLLPVASLLAGAGAAWASGQTSHLSNTIPQRVATAWRFVIGTAFVTAVLQGTVLLRPQQPPETRFLSDLDAAAKAAATPGIATLNETLPEDARVLMVGEAEIFDARFSLIYNTVFDQNLFEQWFRDNDSDQLLPPAAIRQTLADRGVTHIYVNWREMLRYRTTYGYSDFVVPERFDALRQAGLLDSDSPQVIQVVPFAVLPPDQQREATERFGTLIRGSDADRTFVAAELYAVRNAETASDAIVPRQSTLREFRSRTGSTRPAAERR